MEGETGPSGGAPPSVPERGPALARLRSTVRRGISHPWAAWCGLLLATAGFGILVGALWSTRYWAFDTAAWDLGVYNQAMYTGLVDHFRFYYTADLPAGIGGQLFAAHFSPFLIGLLPFYALAPNPSGLLIIQAFGIGLGVIPVYYLARDHLGSPRWAAFCAGFYLLSPLTIGSGWYDFHPEAFLPVTALTAIYYYERRRLAPFLGAWLLSLSVIETMAPFLLVLAGIGLAAALWRLRNDRGPVAVADLKINLVAIVAAAGWLVASLEIMYALSPNGGTFGPGYSGAWSTLGPSSILDVYPRALLDPSAALSALTQDAGPKGLYLLLVFGGFGFLPFFGRRRYLLPALGWIGLAILSNHAGYFVVNDQYIDYVLPFLVPGAIGGIAWMRERELPTLRGWPRSSTIAGILVVGLLVGTGISSPLLPNPYGSFNAVPHGIPTVTEHDQLLHEVLTMIPSTAPVLTTSRLFPEVSDRPNAYVLPASSLFVDGRTFSSVVAQYVNESEFVAVDYLVDFTGATVLAETANLSGFGLRAAADGAYLYERGWSGAPQLWVPFTYTAGPGQISPRLGARAPASDGLGAGVLHSPGQGPGEAWTGPPIEGVPPGSYELQASANLVVSERGPQAGFAVTDEVIDVVTNVTTVSGGGQDYTFSFPPSSAAPEVLANVTVDENTSGTFDYTWSVTIHWIGPGFLVPQGWVDAPGLSARFYGWSMVQAAPPE